MSRLVSVALLVVGVILLVFGINASESLASEVSEIVEGSPTDKSIWLIAGGALLAILGLGGLVRGLRK